MRHKVFRLNSKLSIMGLEMTDLMVLFATWMVSLQILGSFIHPRARLIFACIVTIVALKLWQRVKDKVPDKFGSHLMSWITETETYTVAPDTEQHPLIVDYARVLEAKKVPTENATTLEPKAAAARPAG
jgi:hypothetical protein